MVGQYKKEWTIFGESLNNFLIPMIIQDWFLNKIYTKLIQWPSAFPPPCRIRFLLVPLLCSSAFLLLKNNKKTVKNPLKIKENRRLGRSRGPLGGHLGAFWPPWAPKAEKVPKKLVRCPPLGVPRGTLKSYFFVFLLKST